MEIYVITTHAGHVVTAFVDKDKAKEFAEPGGEHMRLYVKPVKVQDFPESIMV